MTVQELYNQLKEIVDIGYGDYSIKIYDKGEDRTKDTYELDVRDDDKEVELFY